MKKQKSNWLLDAAILLGFLVSFFLNMTGLAVHQWLGIVVFLGIMFHLVNHLDWIKCVFSRFFDKTSARTRVYALIDGLLLYGFVLIIETGLVISTWFNLNFDNYEVWLEIHIFASISTLLLAVLKVGLHWRWIVKTALKIFKTAQKPVSSVPDVLPQAMAISRRDFLATMGVVGLGSALAISNVLPSIKKAEASSIAINNIDEDITSKAFQENPTAASAQSQAAAAETQVQETTVPQTETANIPSTATEQPAPTPNATSSSVTSASLICNTSCPKGRHCSFPGDCRRYSDANGNGLCDLGECG